jgi:spermidine synthase
MSLRYEELDSRPTSLGELMLRRRRMSQFGELDIYEIKLGEAFLMSSLFHEAEHRLSKLALGLVELEQIDVVVGGLGLGYTAVSALEDSRVSSLVVIEYLAEVIEWHRSALVPLGKTLTGDPRCRLVQADFFALSRDVQNGLDPQFPHKQHDVILLDIDHTPDDLLHPTNARFYTLEGLAELSQHLRPGGVFALWADGAPAASFAEHLGKVFASVAAHTIEFDNPIIDGTSEGAVYVARVPS